MATFGGLSDASAFEDDYEEFVVSNEPYMYEPVFWCQSQQQQATVESFLDLALEIGGNFVVPICSVYFYNF